MEIFSQKDYYPTPSSNVISYECGTVPRSANEPVNSADLPALIVHLSSPLEGVDYSAFADFFLIYRNFITPQDLHDLLIYRFRWCIREITTNEAKAKRRQVGEVALVRTFVLLRHSILNYFVQDFLPNITLRLRLIEFLNDRHISHYPKIISSCLINLKKNWVHCSKLVWENIKLNEPDKKDFEAWLHYSLRDFTQLESLHRRVSRLSIYARQSAASPDFRNQSVLSLYKTSDIFKLPDNQQSLKSSKSQRTPSMLLFPDNTSNVYSRHRTVKEPSIDMESDKIPENNRKISRLSKVTLVSTLMKGVDYPSSYAVNKIMPPTPAKNVEFIINSLYLPEELNEQNGTLQGVSTVSSIDNNSNSNSRSNTSSMSLLHRSALGLLAKWMKNHNRNDSSNDKKFMNTINQTNQKPEMDAFVKYVVSISSLNRKFSKEEEEEELSNSDSSRFDILSARTIDEVESLLTLQNQLIEKIQTHTDGNEYLTEEMDGTHQERINDIKLLKRNSFKPSNDNFSAMDNLDLYQTVSSIAQSVISLTNTLNKKLQNNDSNTLPSPSYDALQRRKVKSVTAAYFNKANGNYSTESMRLFDKDTGTSHVDENGPQRLLFHETKKNNSETTSSMTPRRKNNSQSQKSIPSSPLKNVLPDLKESSPLNDSRDDNESATYSYDSELSSSSPPRDIVVKKLRNVNHTMDTPSLKTKTGFLNLREFTFEDTKSLGNKKICDEKESNTSEEAENCNNERNETSRKKEKEIEDFVNASLNSDNCDSTKINKRSPSIRGIKQAAVRPASGRISIARVQSIAITPTKQLTIVDPVRSSSKSIIEEISEVEPLNLEHNKDVTIYSDTSSTVISVSTSKLFESSNNSPIKQTRSPQRELANGTVMSESNRIRLSMAPTIQSVVSDLDSITTGSTMETFETSRDTPMQYERIDLREEYQRGNQDLISNISSLHEMKTIDLSDSNNDLDSPSHHAKNNKYFFSPDDGSIDVASPAKNVEELKSKFLKNENDTNSHVAESILTMDDLGINDTSSGRNTQTADPEPALAGTLDKKDLNDIANMPDDSINDDPITVALMKLEGTYAKTSGKPEKSKSSDALRLKTNRLADEVDMLDIKLPSFPNSPAEKRKSLLIERRRQTIMNIPFTPNQPEKDDFASSSPEKNSTPNADDIAVQAAQIQELIGQYKIQDPRLMVSNNENHIPFILMYDSLSVAQQMTLIEKEILGEIDWKDLLDLKMRHEGPQVISWLQLLVRNETLSGIDLAISRFNLTVDWIISEILLTKSSKMKRNVIQRFIHVADHCKKFQNFNTLMEIILALSSSVVQRFTDAWRLIEPGDLLTWEELKKIPSLDRNYSAIRNLLNSVNPLVGCVPFIVVYLSDLSANSEKKDWILEDKVVNYNKFDTNVQIVKNFIQRVQWSKFYAFEVNHELLSKCVYISTLSQEEIKELST